MDSSGFIPIPLGVLVFPQNAQKMLGGGEGAGEPPSKF